MQPLTRDTQLGPYRIEGVIGAGGMGVVHAAFDARLGRRVAVKVTDERFSERFEREARAIAALTHPNVCTLYDVGPNYLVMELVEGETLAERLVRDPLATDEALAVARQIAEALGAAHDKGIVHRDLKPQNVKITPDGTVKVLDFGIAKSVEASRGDAVTVVGAELTKDIAVGTLAYMAPEQLLQKPVDARADIWAFGVVLYEMVAGRLPFGRRAHEETLSDVLGRDPDWSPIPSALQPLLRRCLQRDPRRRLQHIRDFDLWIEDALHAERTALKPKRPWRVAAGAAAAAALLALGAATQWRSAAPPAELIRMTATLPAGVNITRGVGNGASSLALSPDGRTLVVAGTDADGRQRLYVRTFDRFDATALAGTEGGSVPFFSPDGDWVGFFADGRLKRVALAGGPAVDITAVRGFPAGATWGVDGRIAFAAGARTPLHAVSSAGGAAVPLLELDPGQSDQFRPELLPDGRTLLFDDGQRIFAFDLASRRITALTEGVAPRFASSGHLIFARDTTLLAAPFEVQSAALTGAAVPVAENVAAELSTAGAGTRHYAVSASGHLAYAPGADSYELVVRHADGSERLVSQPLASLENPQFSPDGRKLAVAASRRRDELADIWIHDLDTGAATQLTFDGGRAPVWRPDGSAVTYSHLGIAQGIYTKAADGVGEPVRIIPVNDFHWLVGWTADSDTLVFGRMDGRADAPSPTSSIVSIKDGRATPVVGPGSVWGGRLSRDGRWLAYYELVQGRFEIYVTSFPEGGTRWLISNEGGTDPSWSPNGMELYYRNADRLLAARLDTSAGVRVVSRRVVLEPFTPPQYDDYHLHPDGGSLAYVRPVASGRDVRLVLNWRAQLDHSAP